MGRGRYLHSELGSNPGDPTLVECPRSLMTGKVLLVSHKIRGVRDFRHNFNKERLTEFFLGVCHGKTCPEISADD